MKFKIDKSVFEKFPNLVVAIPIILGFDNTKGQTEALKFLRETEENLKKTINLDEFWKNKKVTAYLDCFKTFGVDPEKFRPAHVALSIRVLEGGQLPDINPLVNYYNAMSLKYTTPFGGENLDAVYGDFILQFAEGGEQWIPIGSTKSKPAVQGELIWRDDFDLSTRALNWRQCDRTKMTPEVKNGYFIMDGFSDLNKDVIEQAAKEFVTTVEKLFGGNSQIYWLDKNNPEFEIDFKSRNISEIKKVEKVKEKQKNYYHAGSITEKIASELLTVLKEYSLPDEFGLEDIKLEHPTVENFGDYSTNIAMKLVGNPKETAQSLVATLSRRGLDNVVETISVAGSGFINFKLSKEMLIGEMQKVDENYGRNDTLKGKTILVEHTSPNPQTTIMLGHLKNNFLGMTMARLWEFQGAKVFKDCIVNDRGIHLCRSMFGYLVFANKKTGPGLPKLKNFRDVTDEEVLALAKDVNWRELFTNWSNQKDGWFVPSDLDLKSDHANLVWYVLGSRAYSLDEEIKKQIGEILIAWENKDKNVWELWKMILGWSADGYDETYKRIGSAHDHVWHESDHYEKGKDIVKEGLEKGVFKESQGAIITNLDSYNLPNTVVQKTDGTALYITQDLALTQLKRDKFKADLYVWDIGEEQSLYFKQLFAVCEQLGFGKRENYLHLSYALVNMKGGKKMSTRKGDVVSADDILDEMKIKAKKIGGDNDEIAEAVGLAGLKYSLLRVGKNMTMVFDPETSLSLEGDSGPYIQYTYARAKSVLRKSGAVGATRGSSAGGSRPAPTAEELSLLRHLYKFPEVVELAAKQYAPNVICTYLFELAKRFNNLYNNCPIIGNSLRLSLTTATSQILKNGLNLLGIKALEKM